MTEEKISEKNILVAVLLCLFLGLLGVHRFYLGKIKTGLLMLFTFGGIGIWTTIDFVFLFAGLGKDKNGKTLKWSQILNLDHFNVTIKSK
jgi:TM2 domain-containing membrane protein YozV